MSKPIGWAIVGASGWADSTFGPAIAAANNADFVGAVGSDISKTKAYTAKHGARMAYPSLKEMLADEAVQAVWIATPNHMHADMAVAALEAGKHVLVEKPMALTAAEAERMKAVSRKADRLLSIGYHIRQHPDHQEIHRRWTAGDFGDPVQVRAHLFFGYPDLPARWRLQKETSGSWVLGDVGTHLIDHLIWFLGKPADTHGYVSSPRFQVESGDHGVVVVRFENGGLGIAESSVGAPGKGPRFEFYGTRGFAILEGTAFGESGTVATGDLAGGPQQTETETLNLYQAQAEAFGRAIAGEETALATPDDGIRNMEIIEAARGW